MANEIIQGDSGTVISLTIRDDSQIVDLTNATVEVVIKFKANGIVKQATVTNALQGECKFTLDAADIPHQGVYSFQTTVKFSDGKEFSSQIERFTVGKKMNYVPNVGGGNSNIGGSTTNGNIVVNGMDIKVYDDSTVRSDINNLKNSKHTHSNLTDLERLGINENNKLTLDGVELVSNGNGTIGADGKSAYQIWLDQGNTGTLVTFLNSLKGAKGDKGDTGLTGATGQNGLNGKSAYQIWLDAGNTGTESDFLLSLKGEKGDSGTGGGTVPSNVIYFEDWVGGETVTIDTGSTTPPADTTAPNNVTNLTTSNVTATSLTLSWTASTSSDIASYEIYRGSTLLTTVTGTTYNATGLTEKTQYTFTVKVKDTAGNIASGTSVTVTTADVTAPNNVTNLTTSNITATSLTLNWTASSSTDVGEYDVYNGATLLGTATGTSYSVSGLTANTAYSFTVKAKDAANNISSGVSVSQTTSSVADTTAPNPVTNLTVGTVTSNSIPVIWTLSSSSDVVNYEVAYSTDGTNYTVSSSVVNASSTTYTVNGLIASANYTIRVVTIDGAGNRSTAVTVSGTTSAPADTTPPVLTITPAAAFTDSQTVTMSSNETADIWYTTDGSDPVGSGTRTKYSSALSLTVTTTVKAYAVDASGNASGVQTVIYTKQTNGVQPGDILFFDDFNRADSTTLGNGWTNYSGANGTWLIGIVGNEATSTGGTYTTGVNKWRRFTKRTVQSNNFAIETKMKSPVGSSSQLALGIRIIGLDDNLIYLTKAGTTGGVSSQYKLWKYPSGGSVTAIATGTALAGENDNIRVEHYSDGLIKVFVNGIMDMSVIETMGLTTTITVGIGVDLNTTKFDDFKILAL